MKGLYLLGRVLGPFATVGFYAYSVLTRTKRSRLVIRNEKGEVLLVRTWLGQGRWGLPGGGVMRGEAPQQAAMRELQEETGISAKEELLVHVMTLRHAGHDEEVFSLFLPSDSLPATLPGTYEIMEAAWYAPDTLPPLDKLAAILLKKLEIHS